MHMQSYSPVPYEYREAIEEQKSIGTTGKIFYFNEEGKFDDASGVITNYEEIAGKGMFITIDNKISIRIDRIITLYGKPGAACDEYYAMGDKCLDCTGGYDL